MEDEPQHRRNVLANHLDPDELAAEHGTDRSEIIKVCRREGIPIYQGKVDKTLFGAHIEHHGIELNRLEREPVPA